MRDVVTLNRTASALAATHLFKLLVKFTGFIRLVLIIVLLGLSAEKGEQRTSIRRGSDYLRYLIAKVYSIIL